MPHLQWEPAVCAGRQGFETQDQPAISSGWHTCFSSFSVLAQSCSCCLVRPVSFTMTSKISVSTCTSPGGVRHWDRLWRIWDNRAVFGISQLAQKQIPSIACNQSTQRNRSDICVKCRIDYLASAVGSLRSHKRYNRHGYKCWHKIRLMGLTCLP